MKRVRLTVELKIPETLQECKSLWGDKGDCLGCAYRPKDILQDCKHQKILEAIDKGQCWNAMNEDAPSWNDVKNRTESE